jgi:hypothetical protein
MRTCVTVARIVHRSVNRAGVVHRKSKCYECDKMKSMCTEPDFASGKEQIQP